MHYKKQFFSCAIMLLCVMTLHAFKVVVVNNTINDERIKVRLKGSDAELEHDLGFLKANGGIGEKKFEGSHTLCIDYIKVGDLKPEIFEVTKDQYNNFMAVRNNPRDVTDYFNRNRNNLRHAPSMTGTCAAEDRRFDIIGNIINIMDTHPIIITKSVY